MFLETLALMYGFLLSVKVQCYRTTTHVQNYHSFFTLRLFCGKFFIWFCLDILKQILWGILFGSASRINWDKLTVSEIVQDIESVGQHDWFICHIFLILRAWNYHIINICDLFFRLVYKLERSLHKWISWWLRLAQVFSDWWSSTRIVYKNFVVI